MNHAAAQDFVWAHVFDSLGDTDTGTYTYVEMLGAVFFK